MTTITVRFYFKNEVALGKSIINSDEKIHTNYFTY